MNKKKKFMLYGTLLAIGLLTFILELFVFQKPNGVLGFAICLTSIYLTIGSIIKLCRLSDNFKDAFFISLDLLMFLP